jgi:hypothetical protein
LYQEVATRIISEEDDPAGLSFVNLNFREIIIVRCGAGVRSVA